MFTAVKLCRSLLLLLPLDECVYEYKAFISLGHVLTSSVTSNMFLLYEEHVCLCLLPKLRWIRSRLAISTFCYCYCFAFVAVVITVVAVVHHLSLSRLICVLLRVFPHHGCCLLAIVCFALGRARKICVKRSASNNTCETHN
ncbi:hypothetical protein AB6A40_002787 [Gnathostoma spinigerum]|uniref:Uncharacterized protein n=1 Tax=Gnathostoma spinigerum TaxID=75299 RepID=A0ABD6EGL0_9BILA